MFFENISKDNKPWPIQPKENRKDTNEYNLNIELYKKGA